MRHRLARAEAVHDVTLAAAVHLHVHGQHHGVIAGGLDACQEVGGPAAVAVVVELEHLGSRACLGHVLDRPARGARQELERVALRGAARQDSGMPRREVERSISRTSTRMSWRMASRSIARRFRFSVISVSAPPSPKFHASRGRTFLACFRISGSVTNLSVMVQYDTASRRPGQGVLGQFASPYFVLGHQRRSTYSEYASRRWLRRASSGSHLAQYRARAWLLLASELTARV